MASFTYNAVGNKEDLVEIITNITPNETPLMNQFGKTEAKAMTHAWLTDSLNAPGTNKHMEDADFVAVAAAPRERFDNFIQIFMKGYFVTDSQEAVQKAGIKSEIAYQMQKAMKEIAKDVEYAILTNATKTAGDAATAGQLGGIKYWNDANVTDMETAALTEPKFNDAIQKAWEAGGTPSLVICSGKNKRVISGFTAGAQKTKEMADKKLTQVVDINIVGIAC